MNVPPELETLRDWLRFAVSRFTQAGLSFGHGFPNACDEAMYLLLHTLHLPLEQAEPFLDAKLTHAEHSELAALFTRRIEERVPAAYLTREAWLGDFRFHVDERVLIPRSFIAEILPEGLAPYVPDPSSIRAALDLCTGCGCLAVLLAHVMLLERGLLPFVVGSQTVPILAIAPMVVIGLGSRGIQGWKSVAILAAWLTFFPVCINTLRGLKSPDPRAVELMESYAASRWRVLWQLRVPSSVPYIFTALKISATASVIGAIIGETPASIQGGLGGAIVNFNQYYSLQPTFLWATNVVCAAMGLLFFGLVVLAEHVVVRRAPENVV